MMTFVMLEIVKSSRSPLSSEERQVLWHVSNEGTKTVAVESEEAIEVFLDRQDRKREKYKRQSMRRENDPVLKNRKHRLQLERQRRNRETISENRRVRRDRVFDVLGGAICAQCGCTFKPILQVNHVNGGGCQERKVDRYPGAFITDILIGERPANEFNVLCVLCNWLDHVQRKFGDLGFKITWQSPERPRKYTDAETVMLMELGLEDMVIEQFAI